MVKINGKLYKVITRKINAYEKVFFVDFGKMGGNNFGGYSPTSSNVSVKKLTAGAEFVFDITKKKGVA